MKKNLFALVSYLCFVFINTDAQCPERAVLINRIVYLRDSSRIPPKDQLPELLSYVSKMNKCPYQNDSTHAFLLRRIGVIFYFQNDYLKATQYFRESIKIIADNETKPSVNPTQLISNYYWLSVFYDSLHNVTEKIRAVDSCIAISMRLKASALLNKKDLNSFEANESDAAFLRALYVKVEYFFDVGDYHRCISTATVCENFAWQYANRVGESNQRQYVFGVSAAYGCLEWKITALLKLGSYKEAEEIIADKIEQYKKANLRAYLGTIYEQLAEVEISKQDFQKAIFYFDRALGFEKEVGNRLNCKSIANNKGSKVYFQVNQYDKAMECFKQALSFSNKDDSKKILDVLETLNIMTSIANVYVKKGSYDLGFQYFQRAFDQIRPGIKETDILDSSLDEFVRNKRNYYVTDLLIFKGDAFKKRYEATRDVNDLTSAINVYKVADRLLDRINERQSDLKSKVFWRSDSRHLYEHAIDACFLNNDFASAFYFFEKSRAVLLNDQLNEQSKVGSQDILSEAQLNKKISLLKKESDDPTLAPDRYTQIQNDLIVNEQALDKLRQTIKKNNPLYYQSFFDTSFITPDDVRRNLLNDHQSFLELFAGDSAVYVLAITRQEFHLRKISKPAFDNLSTAYLRYLSNQQSLNRNFDSFSDISSQLYQHIFRNINLPAGRIIISPDGHYFPFESLITSKRPVTYFVENWAVSYTYSARYLLNNFFATSSAGSNLFFGMAPVSYAKGLPALSGSDESLLRIQTYFRNPTNFVGSKATKDNFLKEYYRYRIVQLYTHATDSSSSGDPEIYFADSTLSLSDLFYENKPASNLIVLSACETASGKLYNGEGVFSFNRQFAALGIPSCVSTLWQADSKSTYRITELFYKFLTRGLPMDVALQSAKKEFMLSSGQENQLPYYWAAPILVGQSGSIEISKRFPWRWVAALSILALIGIVGWQARKKKNSKQ